MKKFKFAIGVLSMALTMMLSSQSVSGAEQETSYSYDTVELEYTDEKVEAIGIDIPGTELDEAMTVSAASTFGGTKSYSYDTIGFEPTNQKIEAIGFMIPGESKMVSYAERAAEKSVSKQYDVDVEKDGTVIVKVSQTTDWSYAPGISSTLTGHNVLYQNVKAGYAIESGGNTKTTNADGTQQIADYFRIISPDGTISRWYRVLAVCSVNGVVSNSVTMLNY